MVANPSHHLPKDIMFVPSGHRYIQPNSRTNRHKNSLVPAAIGLLNDSLGCTVFVFILFIFCCSFAVFISILVRGLYVLLLAIQQTTSQG